MCTAAAATPSQLMPTFLHKSLPFFSPIKSYEESLKMEEGEREKLGTLLELEKCFGTVLMIPYYLDVNGSIHGLISEKNPRSKTGKV